MILLVSASHAPCAVLTCQNRGTAHPCPYDLERHRHGRIHYTCHRLDHFAPQSTLVFRPDGWHRVCDLHYQQILDELLDADNRRRLAGP